VPNRTRIESGEKREGKREEREDTDVSEAVIKSREGGELNLGVRAAGDISGRITEMRRRRVAVFFENYMKHAVQSGLNPVRSTNLRACSSFITSAHYFWEAHEGGVRTRSPGVLWSAFPRTTVLVASL